MNKQDISKKMKGHVYERTIRGGFEKIRENVSPQEFKKHFSAVHKIGSVKGQPKYKYR